ncbi:MAG: hypothetical protein KBC50_00730 [Candidatus Pacebacteria bacterium]|nr:hypothetical protein [Candidatus Paceibacterota bacterium]
MYESDGKSSDVFDYGYHQDLEEIKRFAAKRKREVRSEVNQRPEQKAFNWTDILKKEDPTLFVFPVAPTNR